MQSGLQSDFFLSNEKLSNVFFYEKYGDMGCGVFFIEEYQFMSTHLKTPCISIMTNPPKLLTFLRPYLLEVAVAASPPV